MKSSSTYDTLGIIPARGGSKGVLRKNIRLVAGRPLIAYTIEAAQQAKTIARFVVSTEDQEIAEICRSLGSDVILRPQEIARDDTPMFPVIHHALRDAEQKDCCPKYIVLLQPTTPLRTPEDIDAVVQLLIDSGVDSVISVDEVSDYHPSRMYTVSDEGRVAPYAEEPKSRLRQELKRLYHRNGAIYACTSDLVKGKNTLIGPDTRAYVMPRERSINIDDEFDLLLADLLIERQSRA